MTGIFLLAGTAVRGARIDQRAAWIRQSGLFRLGILMNRDARLKRLRFRAEHRGTREADMLIGGFFERHHLRWSDEEIAWYEAFLEEQDVDIMAWAIGTAEAPKRFAGPMIEALKRLDYVRIAR